LLNLFLKLELLTWPVAYFRLLVYTSLHKFTQVYTSLHQFTPVYTRVDLCKQAKVGEEKNV